MLYIYIYTYIIIIIIIKKNKPNLEQAKFSVPNEARLRFRSNGRSGQCDPAHAPRGSPTNSTIDPSQTIRGVDEANLVLDEISISASVSVSWEGGKRGEGQGREGEVVGKRARNLKCFQNVQWGLAGLLKTHGPVRVACSLDQLSSGWLGLVQPGVDYICQKIII